jgi:hypothetical protein
MRGRVADSGEGFQGLQRASERVRGGLPPTIMALLPVQAGRGQRGYCDSMEKLWYSEPVPSLAWGGAATTALWPPSLGASTSLRRCAAPRRLRAITRPEADLVHASADLAILRSTADTL